LPAAGKPRFVTVNSRGGKAMTASFQSVFRDGVFTGRAGIVTGAGSGIGSGAA